MNVKKKVWYQIDTVGGSRRQKISAVLVLTKLGGITPPMKTRNTVKLTQQQMRSLSITDSGISPQSNR